MSENQPMNLFVDSNIFLQFYHFKSDDLEELKKLSKLIADGDIRLFVTKQVKDEVKRNRDIKISDAYKRFRDSKPDIALPQICKSYTEYDTIKDALSRLKRAVSELDSKLRADISDKTLKADEVIDELFEAATLLDCSRYVDAAKTRYHLGNPPGKNNKYGDAISWETLLGELESDQDLFFISDDKDFKSPLSDGGFNSFLLDEWSDTKNSVIHFYTQLSEFFRNHHQDIQLRTEEEKDELIEQLAQSGNFARTHIVIGKLSKFDGFSDTQVKQLVEAGLSNSQVSWIAGDPDVRSFYSWVTDGKEGIFDTDTWNAIRNTFREEEQDSDGVHADDDDLPF